MYPNVECICNDGFEDQLQVGSTYKVHTITNGSYEIENGKGEKRYYGRSKFKIV